MSASSVYIKSRPSHVGRRLFVSTVLAAFVVVGGGLALTGSAYADGPQTPTAADGSVELVVSVILATKGQGPVTSSKELAHLNTQFERSFGAYRHFEFRGSHALRVGPGQSPTVKLPNGTELTLRHDGQRDGYHQLNLAVGGLKTTVQVHPGATFFQAGRAFEGGVLVLAFEIAR